jgi:hypothetical protein
MRFRDFARKQIVLMLLIKGIYMPYQLESTASTPVVANDCFIPKNFALVQSSLDAVVLNDKQTSVKYVQVTLATYAAIEKLVNERELWQENSYRTSNEQLYVILQKCYGMYKAMEGSSAESDALRGGLRDYISVKGYTFTKSTHSLSKIIKCVFGFDRRRVSTYSIVLRSALAKGVVVVDVAEFIRNQGGVEEIRLAKSPNAMSSKQKAKIASSSVEANNIGVFTSPTLSRMLDAGKIGANTVLIGTWQSDGSVVIRAVVESDTALNTALTSHYSSIKAVAKEQAVELKAALVVDCKQEAIQVAAASASLTA